VFIRRSFGQGPTDGICSRHSESFNLATESQDESWSKGTPTAFLLKYTPSERTQPALWDVEKG
jgi:hypothetical protein